MVNDLKSSEMMSRDVGTIMFDIVFEMDNSFRWVMEFKISDSFFVCNPNMVSVTVNETEVFHILFSI